MGLLMLVVVAIIASTFSARYAASYRATIEDAKLQVGLAAMQQSTANLRREDNLRNLVRRLEYALSAGDGDALPRLGAVEQVRTAQPGGRLAGDYLRHVSDRGFVEVAAASGTAAAPPRDFAPSVALARRLVEERAGERSLLGLLYLSDRGRFMVHAGHDMQPLAEMLPEWTRGVNDGTVGGAIAALRPFMLPPDRRSPMTRGEVRWRPLQRGDSLSGRTSTISAGVIDQGALAGVLILLFRADDVIPLSDHAPAFGRLALVENGHLMIADSTRPPASVAINEPVAPALAAGLASARAARGEFVWRDGKRYLARELATFPNFALLLEQDERAAVLATLRQMIPWLLISALALFALLAMILIVRRIFLVPAVVLLESMDDPGGTALDERLPELWRPWARQIAENRRNLTHYVESLEQQNVYTGAILASAIDCIVTADDSGRITDFNPAAEQVFGWRKDEVVGRRLEETIIPPDYRDAHRAGMTRYVSGGRAQVMGRHVEVEALRKDGSRFPAELALAEARLDSRRFFIGYIRDLSDSRDAAAALAASRESLHQSEKLAALGQLLAGIAHELNNPLAIVIGRSAMLREKLAGTVHAAALDKLASAADRCGRIVRTFLSMARQTGPRRSMVQLNELVDLALDITGYGLDAAGITVERRPGADLPLTNIDGDQVVQVLINLIVNAQHAMEHHDGPRVLTLASRFDAAGRTLRLTVADSGPGVPAAIAGRIFDPFFTTKDTGSGTGMGLSVSKGMIEAQGGQLELVRNAPAGATFEIVVPLANSETGAALAEPAPDRPRLGTARALVVDDEPEIAAMLQEHLEALGVTSTVAHAGDAALDLAGEGRFDLLLTDIRMPGLDGFGLYRALKARGDALAGRTIFLSGDVLHVAAAQMADLDDRPILEKPFDPDDLRRLVEAVLAQRRG